MRKTNKKEKWLHLRLSEQEYNIILARFNGTFSDSLSQYAREVLMGKPLIGRVRDQALDDVMSELTNIRKDLNAYGKNFNQVAKKVNQHQDFALVSAWLSAFENEEKNLGQVRSELEKLIQKLLEKWLP